MMNATVCLCFLLVLCIALLIGPVCTTEKTTGSLHTWRLSAMYSTNEMRKINNQPSDLCCMYAQGTAPLCSPRPPSSTIFVQPSLHRSHCASLSSVLPAPPIHSRRICVCYVHNPPPPTPAMAAACITWSRRAWRQAPRGTPSRGWRSAPWWRRRSRGGPPPTRWPSRAPPPPSAHRGRTCIRLEGITRDMSQ